MKGKYTITYRVYGSVATHTVVEKGTTCPHCFDTEAEARAFLFGSVHNSFDVVVTLLNRGDAS